MKSYEALSQQLQDRFFEPEMEQIIYVEDGVNRHLHYYVTGTEFRRIAIEAGHSQRPAARAMRWLERFEKQTRIEPTFDYGFEFPNDILIAGPIQGQKPLTYIDLSKIAAVEGYYREVEASSYVNRNLKIYTTVAYIGEDTHDVYETIADYYDYCAEAVGAQAIYQV
jgi:hypothetical protein